MTLEAPDLKPGDDLQEFGQRLGAFIIQTVGQWQANSKRSQQSTMRVLGMSELGGCREYIRASVAGDPKDNSNEVKWPAAVGTWVGDGMETALLESLPGTRTQTRVTVTLPKTGISISGSIDAEILGARLIDFKSKNTVYEVRRRGPEFKEKVQISGYLLAQIAEGNLPPDATGHLVYIDRSGASKEAWVWSVDAEGAKGWIDAADERLEDVAQALATGSSQGGLRDMPESWCANVGCPFYTACWGEYVPTEVIDHPMVMQALEDYDFARALKKEAEALILNAKQSLDGVEGASDKFTISWKVREGEYGLVKTIDVRAVKAKPAAKKASK